MHDLHRYPRTELLNITTTAPMCWLKWTYLVGASAPHAWQGMEASRRLMAKGRRLFYRAAPRRATEQPAALAAAPSWPATLRATSHGEGHRPGAGPAHPPGPAPGRWRVA